MNRFESGSSGSSKLKALVFWLPILFFVVILTVFIRGVSDIDATTSQKQLESLESALDRSIAQCYCVEGSYPPNLDYIKDHYGLVYDENSFFIAYVFYGGNLYPDVTVIQKK